MSRDDSRDPSEQPLPDSVAANVSAWTRTNRERTDSSAQREWANERFTWGMFGVAEDSIGSPLGDVEGLDIVELGCGTAYISAWLARLGARPVGVDPTPAQLATARRLQEQTGLGFPLVEAPAERVPLPDASFDLAVSEYGASLWADPELWVPEAVRLLRPGGRLVFLTNSVLVHLCAPDVGPVETSLQRSQFDMYRTKWPGDEGIEYHLGHGEWLRLLHRSGFEVEDLIELQAPAEAKDHAYSDFVGVDWARRWPAEEIWVARLRAKN